MAAWSIEHEAFHYPSGSYHEREHHPSVSIFVFVLVECCWEDDDHDQSGVRG